MIENPRLAVVYTQDGWQWEPATTEDVIEPPWQQEQFMDFIYDGAKLGLFVESMRRNEDFRTVLSVLLGKFERTNGLVEDVYLTINCDKLAGWVDSEINRKLFAPVYLEGRVNLSPVKSKHEHVNIFDIGEVKKWAKRSWPEYSEFEVQKRQGGIFCELDMTRIISVDKIGAEFTGDIFQQLNKSIDRCMKMD